MPGYYIAAAESGPHTLEALKSLAKTTKGPFKFFNEQGFQVGTMYPNGEPVMTTPPFPTPWGAHRKRS